MFTSIQVVSLSESIMNKHFNHVIKRVISTSLKPREETNKLHMKPDAVVQSRKLLWWSSGENTKKPKKTSTEKQKDNKEEEGENSKAQTCSVH